MEILRFDESDVPAPKRKSASKGWLALGLVATLMGVGTAFASSTITIPTVSLGQGVAQVTNCDENVNVSPEATGSVGEVGGDVKPVFRTTSIGISNVDGYISETKPGCADQDFGIQVFKKYSGGDPDIRDDGSTLKTISCAKLAETETISSFEALPIECDGTTNTIWLALPNALIDGQDNNAFKILLDATNDIDYVTLVSSAHNDSRFTTGG
jgi:hypothetical protein